MKVRTLSPGVFALSLLIAGTITFLFDIFASFGIAAAVPYALLVVIGVRATPERAVGLSAGLATVLAFIGYFAGEVGSDPAIALGNRLLALATIWLTYFICRQIRNQSRELETRVRDETEFRRIAEERLKNFIETASDWYWESDTANRLIQFSSNRTQMLRDDVVGRTRKDMASVADLADVEKWRLHDKNFDERKPIKDFIYALENRDQETRVLRVTGTPRFDENGVFLGYAGSSSDITAQSLLEERLRRGQKFEAVGRLTGGVAHDFNNLLHIIAANIENVRDEIEMNDTHWDESLSAAENAIDRASALTTQLLTYARQQRLSPEIFDVDQEIRQFVKNHRRVLGDAFGFEVVAPQDSLSINVDRSQFNDALVNLTLNSAEAMPAGGKIVVTSRLRKIDGDTPGEIELAFGDYAEVNVSDSGVGIPAQNLAQVFDPFFTTKSLANGGGLGLSMIYGFVRQTGGVTLIDSTEGEGTAVSMLLPLHVECEKPAAGDAAPSDSVESNSKTILLVEDQDDVLQLVSAMIKGMGYTTLAARNGQDAIDKLESHRGIDLIFTDVVMPGGLSGIEVAEAAARISPNTKVLFTSGLQHENLVADGIDADMPILQKPYRRDDLVAKLMEMLES
jgi:PAS domain S-box-containing protein